jgi:hypothetical protein
MIALRFRLVACCSCIWALCATVHAESLSDGRIAAADDRRVWEYSGGFGRSWFVHEGDSKWVLYRGDGQSYLYVEESRSDEALELRGPYTRLLIRLTADTFEMRRSTDAPWRRTASGRWVSESHLPDRIRLAPQSGQVRLVYFVPSDREAAGNYAPRIRLIVNLVAELLHDDLRSKGHRPRPLEFETRDGEIVVHLLRGPEPAAFYNADWQSDPQAQMTRIHDELLRSFGDPDRHLTIVFAETYESAPAAEAWAGHIARGVAKPPEGGLAVYSSWILKDDFSALDEESQRKLFFDRTPIEGRKAFGSRVPDSPRYEFVEDAFGAVLHELGHALGLPHDYRSRQDIMGSGFRELRWNFDPGARASRQASFSAENARVLMASRYLSDNPDLADFDAPSVTFELIRRGRNLTASIQAADNSRLQSLLLYDRTNEPSSVIGGRALSGREQSVTVQLPMSVLNAGQRPEIEIFVCDTGGNVTRVTDVLDAEQP